MPTAGSVFGEQYIARVKHKMLPCPGLEIQHATEGNHELPGRSRVPREGATRCGFLERDGGHAEFATQQIASRTFLKRETTFLEMRVVIIACPKPYTSDHQQPPLSRRDASASDGCSVLCG